MSKHNLLHRWLVSFGRFMDNKFGWDKLPTVLGILTLIGIRTGLRQQNLFNTGVAPAEA